MKPRWNVVGIAAILLWVALHHPATALTAGNSILPQTTFDPAISKVAEFESLGLPGEHITWVITVMNAGDAAGTNITITDDLRVELHLDSVESEGCAYVVSGSTVTCTVAVLNPGESVRMRIHTTVMGKPADGNLINEARLVGVGPAGTITDSALAKIAVPSGLPATGYPRELPGDGEPSVYVVGLAAFSVVALAAWLIWYRGSRSLRRRI